MRIRDITEAVGRITKQNQTVDVGPDEVTKQAAKFGNKVDKDGRPPTLSKKVKGKSTNVLFNLGIAEGKSINNPKNTFLTKADTAYDFLRVGKTISNLSTAKKSDNRDEPDVMVVPFGGKKEKDHLKKGLKKAGYKTQDADKPGDDAHVDENFAAGKPKKKTNEGYKLQLERDTDMMVLNIVDTATGRRTEVRGKLGYESGNYDPNDKLHMLLDKIGKSADISQLMNGEPVGINPKHPQGASAKAATDKAYSENFADGKKKGNLYHVTYASGLLGMLKDGHLNTKGPSGFADYFSMTADPKYVVSGNPEVQIVIDAGRVSQLETFEQHKEDWDDSGKDNGDWESEYRVEETIPWNYVVAVKILKAKATPEIIELAKKRGVKLVGKDTSVTENFADEPRAKSATDKAYSESLEEALGEIAPNTEIYVDMDGVLADFFGEWSKSQGVSNWKDIKDPAKAIGDIKSIEDFWLKLPVLPQAKNLLQLIKKVKGSYSICTSPLADDPRSEPHKREWVKKNLAFFPPKEVIVTHNKPQFATQKDGTPNILIDDYGVNIDAWEKAGGIGIKYKDYKFDRTAKAIQQHVNEPVDENFADGKKKGKSRPGRVKKSGASCNGSVTALRKRAKNASGEKAKMYHWCANMKSGRKKK